MDNCPTERIVKTPEVCGGRARIVGHRVRVHDIVGWYEHQGMTDLAQDFLLEISAIEEAIRCEAAS
ncbi:MAG: DUF433 domain-containing protein [Bryobacteraceae bacterium]